MKEKAAIDKVKQKKFYTLLIVIVPSILMVLCAIGITNFLIRSLALLILFVLQIVVVQGLLDDYYG